MLCVGAVVRRYTVDQFFETSINFAAAFSRDERILLFTSNRSGINNAFTVPVTGGHVTQLTRSTKETTNAISFFPNDRRVLLARDDYSIENYHLHVLEEDGTTRDLTPGRIVRARFVGWSREGSAFFYATNDRDARFYDVYRMEVDSFRRTLIFQDEQGLVLNSVSDDEGLLAFRKRKSKLDSEVYIYDVAASELSCITRHEGAVLNLPATFDRTSQFLYCTSDKDHEFTYLLRHEIVTGEIHLVDKRQCQITSLQFSHSGRYIITCSTFEGQLSTEIFDQKTNQPIVLPLPAQSHVTFASVSRSERLVAFYAGSDRRPSALYVHELETGATRLLVDGNNLGMNPCDLVESDHIWFDSFDGLRIPALLWKPHQASAANKVPALVWAHGGPGGQTTRGFSSRIQLFVNHGYLVLGVNFRGSAGYGKKFAAADERKHGCEPLRDCVEAKGFLASLDFIDESRIGIIGSSYGGYMVLAALVFAPEAFQLGVDLFGVSNWARALDSFPPYWGLRISSLHQDIGDPGKDLESLREISPLFHADKIKRPLMVLHGANDPRVQQAEADEMVQAVRSRGGIVEYLLFDDEAHGFSKRRNKIKAYTAILTFLDKYLGPTSRICKSKNEAVRGSMKLL